MGSAVPAIYVNLPTSVTITYRKREKKYFIIFKRVVVHISFANFKFELI